jgi:hypothetical protein
MPNALTELFAGFGRRKDVGKAAAAVARAAAEKEDKGKAERGDAPPGDGEDDDDDDDDDDAPPPAAEAAAAALRREGAVAERQRIAAIVKAGGGGKVEASLRLALNTDATPAAAAEVLAAVPETGKASGSTLDRLMAERSPIVGVGTAANAGKAPSLADAMTAKLRAQGVLPPAR